LYHFSRSDNRLFLYAARATRKNAPRVGEGGEEACNDDFLVRKDYENATPVRPLVAVGRANPAFLARNRRLSFLRDVSRRAHNDAFQDQ